MPRVPPPERLTIDLTVARDFLDPARERHVLAAELFARARTGEIEVAVAPQGHRLDAQGDLAQRLRELFADESVTEARQLAYLSEVTYPSESLYPGQLVAGLADAWDEVIQDWRTHDGEPPQMADRMHVETHILERRDVFVTDDRPLLRMCKRLREEHDFPIFATGLEAFLARSTRRRRS